MKIAEAALRSGVSAKMIRHYERLGLVQRAPRQANGYRAYDMADIEALRFVGRARQLGFSLAEAGELAAYWRDGSRPSREVKRLAERHLRALEDRVREMRAMIRELRALAGRCRGDDAHACPIIDELAGRTASHDRAA